MCCVVTEITRQTCRTQEYTFWSCRNPLGGLGVSQCPWPLGNERGFMQDSGWPGCGWVLRLPLSVLSTHRFRAVSLSWRGIELRANHAERPEARLCSQPLTGVKRCINDQLILSLSRLLKFLTGIAFRVCGNRRGHFFSPCETINLFHLSYQGINHTPCYSPSRLLCSLSGTGGLMLLTLVILQAVQPRARACKRFPAALLSPQRTGKQTTQPVLCQGASSKSRPQA